MERSKISVHEEAMSKGMVSFFFFFMGRDSELLY